jgi:hypothetical protein
MNGGLLYVCHGQDIVYVPIKGDGHQSIKGLIDGRLEVKLPAIWTEEKQSRAEAERRERSEEKSRRERVRRKKMEMREKVGRSKSRLAKAAGAEPAGQRTDEKLHAVVARSTFPSQNVQNTPRSDHFWKLRC